jgi:hypothetical protein
MKYDREAFALMDDFYNGRIDIGSVGPRRGRAGTNNVESVAPLNSNSATNKSMR